MATQIKDAETADVFHASREYVRLTAKQRAWLDIFIFTRDAVLATKTAYNAASDTYARLLAHQIEANSRIRAALNVYQGRSEQEIFLADLQETIRRAPKGSVAQVRAQALYARMKFGVSTPDSDHEPVAPTAASESPLRFQVGEICLQDGKQYRVTSIDVNGQPLTADEVA